MKYVLISFLVLILIALAFFASRVLPLMTAKPNLKVDYVAEYNKATKPTDFNPEDNAAPLYQKAFESLTEMSDILNGNWKIWPGDMNEIQFETLENWLASNAQALTYALEAAKKPYCWIERHGQNEALFNIEFPELAKFRIVAYGLDLQAKLKAFKGQQKSAFDQVLDIHQMGQHYSGPVTLVEQLVGMAVESMALQTAFSILDKTKVDAELLADFQTRLENKIQKSKPLNYSVGEKINVLDMIQQMFTDDSRGDGKLIPAKIIEYKDKKNDFWNCVSYSGFCLKHPGRRDTVELLTKLYDELNKLAAKTPWQMQKDGTSYQEYIDDITSGNYLINDDVGGFGKIFEISHRGKVTRQALLTTLAVLRYKTDKGLFPENLNQLLDSGYLSHLPVDPFSGNGLIYKRTEDNFLLYSAGADFDDDGGAYSRWGNDEDGGDQVFWPVQK